MKIPKGIELQSDSEWVLKVKNNVYWQLQKSRVWNKFLGEKPTSSAVGFRQRKVDECMFYRGGIIYILYTDDYILEVPDKE